MEKIAIHQQKQTIPNLQYLENPFYPRSDFAPLQLLLLSSPQMNTSRHIELISRASICEGRLSWDCPAKQRFYFFD